MDNPYQLLPDLTPEEYEVLRESIRADGVKVPIEYDEDGIVLDGHHRLRACQELGITEWPRIVRLGMSEKQKRDHVLALNLARRNLTGEQRHAVVIQLRSAGMSTRTIAKTLGIGRQIVRDDLAGGLYNPPETIAGSDGKQYPAQRIQDYNAPGISLARHTHQLISQSTSNEWYTPPEYIEAARAVMGGIDLDPASNDIAQGWIKASTYFTEADDGLAHEWHGRLWLNPPWGQLTGKFISKMAEEKNAGRVTEAIILVNAHATDTQWFAPLWEGLLCFTNHRINYGNPSDDATGGSTHGSVFVYFGPHEEAFMQFFRRWGATVRAVTYDNQ